MKKGIKYIAVAVAGIIVACGIFANLEIIRVEDHSMEPELESGQLFIALKYNETKGELKPGQIVVLDNMTYANSGEGDTLVKKVIAVENQRIEMIEGNFLIDGKLYDRKNQSHGICDDDFMAETRIKKNKVFVIGNNLPKSTDSRSLIMGQVDLGDIESIALFSIWPLDKIGVLDNGKER